MSSKELGSPPSDLAASLARLITLGDESNDKNAAALRSSPLDDLARWAKQLADLPAPVAYIVTDADIPKGNAQDAHDARGRRYLQVNPSLLDAVPRAEPRLYGIDAGIALSGIPVIPREDLPKGWPDEA